MAGSSTWVPKFGPEFALQSPCSFWIQNQQALKITTEKLVTQPVIDYRTNLGKQGGVGEVKCTNAQQVQGSEGPEGDKNVAGARQKLPLQIKI
jgi:hypothetical protein